MKKIIITKDAPQPIGPYNQATLFNGMLLISGQIALNPETGELVMDAIGNVTYLVLKNLGAILKEAGYSYDDVLKCSVFVTNMHMFSRINAIYSQYFKEENAPARELVQVAALPRFVNVEISVIAAK